MRTRLVTTAMVVGLVASVAGLSAPAARARGLTPHVSAAAGAKKIKATALVSDGDGYCALLSGGTADCWGSNAGGELGNGTTINSDVPVRVKGLTSATALASDDAADGYCALLTGGTADCWGDNTDGELGDGTTTSSDLPVPVSGLTNIVALTGGHGQGHGYCALLADGTADCWGSNIYGELGSGTTIADSDVPLQVSGLTGATALTSGGYGDCALLVGGAAECWGSDFSGELGNGTRGSYSEVAVRVSGLTDATALTSDQDGYCAVLSSGAADCWGYNKKDGLGDGHKADSDVPVPVRGLTDATALASDSYGDGYCAVLSSGAADCWGYDADGELGNGTTTKSKVAVPVSGLASATALASESAGYCALLSGGTADCWGDNTYGELGDGGTTTSDLPVEVSGLTNGIALAGTGFTGATYCALLSGGTVNCWGYNVDGELGDGTTRDSDVPVPTGPFV